MASVEFEAPSVSLQVSSTVDEQGVYKSQHIWAEVLCPGIVSSSHAL